MTGAFKAVTNRRCIGFACTHEGTAPVVAIEVFVMLPMTRLEQLRDDENDD